jgi:hypothetical protein
MGGEEDAFLWLLGDDPDNDVLRSLIKQGWGPGGKSLGGALEDQKMATAPAYEARPIKRPRRTRAEIETICDWMYNLVAADHPMTVRQLFYRLVSEQVIEKTESEYNGTVGRLLTKMRREGVLPYEWIADNTRWMRKPQTHSSLHAALEESVEFYRRALWNDQNAYVEVWLEKDALAGVLLEETAAYDVPLMVTRGYSSLTFLHSAAEAIAEQNKPAYLYYFGDHDPSGVDIPRNVEQRLRELAPDAEIVFERVAVNPDQIREWNLPTRPTKKSDSRSRNFTGGSVEVDAIPPAQLRQLAKDRIESHIDQRILQRTMRIEKAERETLARIVEQVGEDGA